MNLRFNPTLAAASPLRLSGLGLATLGLWIVVCLGLTACGGGESETSSMSAAPPDPRGTGSIVIKTTMIDDTPVSSVEIDLNDGFNGRSKTTDSNGEAQFDAVPAGDASAAAFARGYFSTGQPVTVVRDTVTKVTLILEQVSKATPVILATRAVPSSDGLNLDVEADIAVLGENGAPIETLTASDFKVYALDCSFAVCGVNSNGIEIGDFSARLIPERFGFVPAKSRPSISAAVLLEQSADVALFDPTGLRLGAVSAFFESIAPPDTVALASYQGLPATEPLTIYGGFTSDGASLRVPLNLLAGMERGSNPFYGAVTDMISFTTANTPPPSSDLQRSVAVLTFSAPTQDGSILSGLADRQAMFAAANAARAKDVSVFGVGGAAELAARTGGAFVSIQDPAQLPVVFRSFASIVGRSVGFNRVAFTLNTSGGGFFIPGNTVYFPIGIRISPYTIVGLTVVLPL